MKLYNFLLEILVDFDICDFYFHVFVSKHCFIIINNLLKNYEIV